MMSFWLAVMFNQDLQPALKHVPIAPWQTPNLATARAQLDACGIPTLLLLLQLLQLLRIVWSCAKHCIQMNTQPHYLSLFEHEITLVHCQKKSAAAIAASSKRIHYCTPMCL